MDTAIKRYRFGAHHYLEISDDGMWCRFEDMEAVLKENESLKAEVVSLKAEVVSLKAEARNLEHEAMSDYKKLVPLSNRIIGQQFEIQRLKDVERSISEVYSALGVYNTSNAIEIINELKEKAARWDGFVSRKNAFASDGDF